MYEGFFGPLHLLILLLSATVVFGLPIYLVFFIVKKINQKYPNPPDSGDTGHR